jgi:hypothetical protein
MERARGCRKVTCGMHLGEKRGVDEDVVVDLIRVQDRRGVLYLVVVLGLFHWSGWPNVRRS